jgi:hypothetical protein
MVDNDEDQDKSRRIGAEDRGWSSTCWILDGWMIERSGDAVYGLYRAQGDEEHEFLSLASKSRSMVSPDLASKPLAQFSRFGPQNRQLWFGDLAHKITTMIS